MGKYVIMQTFIAAGNGIAGYRFWKKFAAQSKSKDFKIIVFGKEPRPAFDTVYFSYSFEN